MEVLCGVKSDKGLERSANEDRLYADPQLGLYVVCDGMGGHNAGEIASQLAVEAIHERFHQASQGSDPQMMGEYDPAFLPQTNWLASAVRYANHMIHCEAQENSQYDGMGTTVVSALLNGPVLSIAHVGDSRLYVIRGDSIEPLTADHSLVMEQVRAGLLTEEQAEHAEQSNVQGGSPRTLATDRCPRPRHVPWLRHARVRVPPRGTSRCRAPGPSRRR